ncbi:hypothetical protein MKX01_028845 [Papaver californicum]|nr:hypothetical protein MKX01_028845 [Papaver californicum]
MGLVKAAIGDAIITFLWVFCASTLGIFTSIISKYVGVDSGNNIGATLLITTILVCVLVFIFNWIGDILGGASFNPTGSASFYAAGLGHDNLFSLAFRFPAQTLGAMGGTLAILEVVPQNYKHMLGGPSLKVDVHTGAMAEGVLTFIISFAVLFIVLRGPANNLLKTWMLSMTTVALVVAGSGYTGPSMNPANAFGWAYIRNNHNTWEQFYVYWICPFVGAILAAWVFQAIFPPPPSKQKKA